ncbi:uncharacterized protein [Apostichopus japonicus]|uniref:uncharacterized protein isoform X2 n=1 Tax=Stichopus japonicus TaxID=307972 RepID=UPI003AB40A30
MENLPGRQCWQSVLAVLMLWSFLESDMVIASVVSQASGSSYFVFQQPEYPRDCKEVLNACSSTHNTSGVYLIKPDGYPEPFEAYCDNDLENGGWTVLQRRLRESINFNRTWKDFRNGFGFPRSEVWLGNEKVAFLTNQKQYQLRLEFQNAAGQSYYVTYDNFRISDEWGQYSLSSLGSCRGTPNSNIKWCPTNEIFTNETCERRCEDPKTCVSSTSLAKPERCACVGEYMIHEGNCIPQNQCGCFAADKGGILREGHVYIDLRCTRKSTCRNNRLVDESYQCSSDATCAERNGVRKCYCNPNYQGDGETCRHNCFVADIGSVLREGQFYANSRCTRKSTCRNNRLIDESYQCSDHATCDTRNNDRKCYCNDGYQGDGVECTREVAPKDCYELYVSGTLSDGVYTIYPDGWPSGIQVYCEMESNGGGWTVFQRRSSASTDFYRGWSDYKNGFGNKNQDHWLGSKYIYSITNQKTYQLRIDLRDSGSSSKYAVYSTFSITDEADKYRLSVGSHSGNTGYNGLSYINNKQFSTKDQDNDGSSSYDCAEGHRGAWWYGYYYNICYSYCRTSDFSCYYYPEGNCCRGCTYSNLNGDYDGSTRGTHMFWHSYSLNGYGCSLQYTDMKIRPV